jgi:hypothetical protein
MTHKPAFYLFNRSRGNKRWQAAGRRPRRIRAHITGEFGFSRRFALLQFNEPVVKQG